MACSASSRAASSVLLAAARDSSAWRSRSIWSIWRPAAASADAATSPAPRRRARRAPAGAVVRAPRARPPARRARRRTRAAAPAGLDRPRPRRSSGPPCSSPPGRRAPSAPSSVSGPRESMAPTGHLSLTRSGASSRQGRRDRRGRRRRRRRPRRRRPCARRPRASGSGRCARRCRRSGRPLGAMWRVRLALSSLHVSWWGMTAIGAMRPRPRVMAPPRGSTIGSQSTMPPEPEPATTVPPCQAATSASHTGESLSTERRCIGLPLDR